MDFGLRVWGLGARGAGGQGLRVRCVGLGSWVSGLGRRFDGRGFQSWQPPRIKLAYLLQTIHPSSSSCLPLSLELSKFMSLKYEPASKPLHNSAKKLSLN